ncbi:Uncharacterised protein [Vibrio cholerae]|nr:Uncharacterised protein [Vibrio cholerae]
MDCQNTNSSAVKCIALDDCKTWAKGTSKSVTDHAN